MPLSHACFCGPFLTGRGRRCQDIGDALHTQLPLSTRNHRCDGPRVERGSSCLLNPIPRPPSLRISRQLRACMGAPLCSAISLNGQIFSGRRNKPCPSTELRLTPEELFLISFSSTRTRARSRLQKFHPLRGNLFKPS